MLISFVAKLWIFTRFKNFIFRRKGELPHQSVLTMVNGKIVFKTENVEISK